MLYTAAALLSLLSAAEAYSLGGAALASRETTVLAARGVAVASRRAALVSMQMPGAQDEVKIVADETYGIMMKTLLQTENPLDQEVSANYALIDYAFLQRLDSAHHLEGPGEHHRQLRLDGGRSVLVERVGAVDVELEEGDVELEGAADAIHP